jgi:molybdate transport system substrate-binding protein
MNRTIKPLAAVLALLLIAPTVIACTPKAQTSHAPVVLNVSASAVMTDVLKEINESYRQVNPWISFITNFASGGTIQQQIENGAPCDVFVSAAASFMDNLEKKGLLLQETRHNLLNNKIVLIVPANSTLHLKTFDDLTNATVKKIAIGDPKSVSAGTYAQQTFDFFNISAVLQPKLVLGGDVRQVLTYVETGNVDAGVVFTTDAMTSTGVKVVASAPDVVNTKIVYPVAIIKTSPRAAAAQDYISFLFGSSARSVFEKYGFSLALS